MRDAKIGFIGRVGQLALALMALQLVGCGGGHPLDVVDEGFSGNHPRPRDYPVHGIDVSKFQGDIDWSKVADSGVKFAWIKASEGGDRLDERFQANWEGAKAAGVAARRLPLRLLVPAPDGGDGQLRAERAGRIGRPAARARRRGDADLEDLQDPSHPGRRRSRR